MENLKMHTPDLADKNFKKLAALFPNAVTETITGSVIKQMVILLLNVPLMRMYCVRKSLPL